MAGRLVTVAVFATPAEARLAAAALDGAQIESCVEGEMSAVSLSHLGSGLGGVKLQVREADAERARAVLQEAGDGRDVTASPPWTCGDCGAAMESGFDVCWSCGATRDGSVRGEWVGKLPSAEEDRLQCPMCGADVAGHNHACPHCGEALTLEEKRSVDEDEAGETHQPSARQTLRHAWRASVLGIALCPPVLHVYSAILLSRYHREKAADGRDDDWRATAAFWINTVFILGAIGVFLLTTLRH